MDTGDRFESTEGVYIELLIAEQPIITEKDLLKSYSPLGLHNQIHPGV